jgi:hypothetical protein
MTTTFSSFFKTEESKTKSYNNIKEVAPMPVRFAEHSLLKHQLWLGKAALQVPINCGSLRSGLHCTSKKTGVWFTEEIKKKSHMDLDFVIFKARVMIKGQI